MNPEDIEEHHLRISDLAMEEFDKVKKMGGEEHSRQYREQLIAEIEETYQQYKVIIIIAYLYCHTRLQLGFSAKLRIWQVPACKM